MRLWHYKLIPFLPKSQLLAQKRECDLILKDRWNGKKTNHVLINYIYEYSDISFTIYYSKLYAEFKERNFKFNDKHQIVNYGFAKNKKLICFNHHHNNEYLTICYWNLREKYLRGQKDFSADLWQKIQEFYKKEIKGD